MFNQIPKQITQTNRLPFLIGIVVIVVVLGVFMFRTQMNQKVEIVQSKPKQSIDISSKAEDSSWFNDEKFKNIKINNNESASRRLTAPEIEKQTITSQEVALRKEEIKDEYLTQLEIKKIEDKNRIEQKKLEVEAMKSSLALEIPGPPGSPTGSRRETIRQR